MKSRRIKKAAAAVVVLCFSLLVCQKRVAPIFQDKHTAQAPDLSNETITKTTIDDIFISVKTSKWYHRTRIPYILKTWFQLAKKQTWFFTDTNSHDLEKVLTDGHIVNTNCSSTHERESLCCKMSAEYDHYLETSQKWFCHFDDDNYVNVPRLVSVLQKYDHQEDWYLGRNSFSKLVRVKNKQNNNEVHSFMFATGGAGFCISKNLAYKMIPVASNGRFTSICNNILMPDDITIGFVIEVMLQKKLTIVPEFHSHLEKLNLLLVENLRDQISFSYFIWKRNRINIKNVINVPAFKFKYDPTRFLSLHCFLFPHAEFCPR